MILVKLHQNPNGQKILTLCDRELLGKKFEEGKKQLDLTTDFYKGEEKSEQEIQDLIKEAYIINFIGEESLKLMQKLNLIGEEQVIRIQNIPHAQIILIKDNN